MSGKFCWGQALGVYLADGRLTLTCLASTPVGTKVLGGFSQSVQDASPGTVLGRWLNENLTPRQRRRIAVCIGLGAEQTFYSTCAMDGEAGQEVTLEDMLGRTNAGAIDGASAAADFVPFKFAGSTLYSVSACQRKLAEELHLALTDAGVTQCRLGPAPWYVLGAAGNGARPPRGWKVFINVLLSETGGLALLVAHGQPVLWRRFAVAPGRNVGDIVSAARYIELHAASILGGERIHGVVVQGRVSPDVEQELPQELGREVIFKATAGLDHQAYSLAMAREARGHERSLDLFRTLRPPPSVSQMFPRKLAVVMLLAVACTGMSLYYHLCELRDDAQNIRRQSASYTTPAAAPATALNNDRNLLRDEVAAVGEFLSTRIIWSNYLRDMPTRLGQNAALQSFQGAFEMNDLSNKSVHRKVNRSLLLRCMARFTDRNSAPKEIDSFLDALRNVELLKRDFPVVGLAEIKWRKEGTSDVALFTVIAMPKQKTTTEKN